MTTTEQLAALKEKIGAAVGYEDAAFIQEIDYRLSDVLVVAQEHCGPHWYERYVIPIVDVWNLRTDDLTKQTPETIAFIHSLLVTV